MEATTKTVAYLWTVCVAYLKGRLPYTLRGTQYNHCILASIETSSNLFSSERVSDSINVTQLMKNISLTECLKRISLIV